MRRIIRKISRQEELTPIEYSELLQYIEELRHKSPPSYYVFYEKYAGLLYLDYNTLIPKYAWNMDNLIDFLICHPDLHRQGTIPLTAFPPEAQPYLYDTWGGIELSIPFFWQNILNPQVINTELPRPRTGNIIVKYEDANPYKERGLKYHFDRLLCYSFISRIQTYRYLTRNKASFDRFEVIAPDCLGGIFTNKEKSIYYYVFLTESSLVKAQNAVQLLNYTFYGRNDGD